MKIGFSAEKYIEEQSKYIRERINSGNSERLYLEFGGKFVQNKHAARVRAEIGRASCRERV